MSRVGGNETLYQKLLGKFETNVDMPGFDTAIAAQDFEEAGRIVHAAKGVAGNLSLTAFYEESVILMDQLRGGGTPQGEDVKLFRQLYTETLAAIKAYLE
jgi:HPt (histidine-containing phosphotransfer) domain-containing protein